MAAFDLILRGGTVVTPSGLVKSDIGVSGEKIAALQPDISSDAKETIDANGLHIFPGVIDAHVHFNEPGRTEWEGFETGSRALAAGGGTMFFEMPLNAHPPTTDAASFRLKSAAAEKNSVTDFSLWGGLVPGNLDHLEELADCGVIGFKAFMSNSGIEDFSSVDDHTLREGMKRAAKLRLPVAVHAESDTITQELAQQCLTAGRTSIRDYLGSRPIRAELDAIRRAIDIAGETGCALQIVHVSSGEGVRAVVEARQRRVDVTCETCPHYLTLTEEDVEKIGAVAKCAPPIRASKIQDELWRHLAAGEITTVGSDHSPSPPGMKKDSNFFKVWGGISGVQHTLSLLLTEGHFKRDVPMPLIASLLSGDVASRFKLPRSKGRIEVGTDADLAIVNLQQSFEVKKSDLLYRHPQSPYVGRILRGRVVRTLLRGNTIWNGGKIVASVPGRLVKPLR